MEINFKQSLIGPDKNPLKEGETQLDLAEVSIRSLSLLVNGEQPDPKQSYRKGKLAMRIGNLGSLDLNAEDVTLLKECIGKVWSPLIVYAAWELLDPSPKVENA